LASWHLLELQLSAAQSLHKSPEHQFNCVSDTSIAQTNESVDVTVAVGIYNPYIKSHTHDLSWQHAVQLQRNMS
jgi:hypothetical protein